MLKVKEKKEDKCLQKLKDLRKEKDARISNSIRQQRKKMKEEKKKKAK